MYFIFLKQFYSNEKQKIEVNSDVVGLFESKVENSFLIIHVSNTISYVFLSTPSDTNLMSTFCNSNNLMKIHDYTYRIHLQ